MIVKAEQRYVRMSPRKLRLVVGVLSGVSLPAEAFVRLGHMQKRAAGPIVKTIRQAVANAKNNLGLKEEDLVIKEVQVGEGPVYKRGRAGARGRVLPIQKKTSHIRVVLETTPQGNAKLKAQSSKPKLKAQNLEKGGQ